MWENFPFAFIFYYVTSLMTCPTLSDVPLDKLLMSRACPRDWRCGTHLLNCEPDGVVKVKDAIHGYKSPAQQPLCLAGPRDLCDDGKEADECCSYENATDCLQQPPASDLDLLHDTCQGKGHCLFRSRTANDGPCDASEGYTPFSAVAYECINRSLLLNPVNARSFATGSDIHIFYPGRYGNQQLSESPGSAQRLQVYLSHRAANDTPTASDKNGTHQDFLSRSLSSRHRCVVTGSWNLHLGVPQQEGEAGTEMAVQVVYLRLVGTRGCTKVTVQDQEQQSIFSCRPGLVTTVMGRQLKRMRAPLEVHIQLAASIWEDDFVWLQLQSITDDPFSVTCFLDVEEKATSTSAATVTESDVDWTTVVTGLAVTGTLICVCLLLAGGYFLHRWALVRFCRQLVDMHVQKHSVRGFGKYDLPPRPGDSACENTRRVGLEPPVQSPPFCHPARRHAAAGPTTDTTPHFRSSPPSSRVQPSMLPACSVRSTLPATTSESGSAAGVSLCDTRQRLAGTRLGSAPKSPGVPSHVASEAVQVVLYDEALAVTDLDAVSEAEGPSAAHARCTEEDEGSSVDSTVFDFDSICDPGDPPASTQAQDNSGDYEVMARSSDAPSTAV